MSRFRPHLSSNRKKSSLKILLANPCYEPVETGPGLRPVEREFGVIPPINLLYVASALRRQNVDVTLIDGEVLRMTDEAFTKKITDAAPDVIGFTATTFSYHHVRTIAKKIRELCSAVICVGGIHASYYPELMAREDSWDYVAIGEIEAIAEEFVKLLKGERTPKSVPGIAFRDGDEVVVNPPPLPVQELDLMEFPARDLVDNGSYFSLLSKWHNFTLMLSSRGCPWRCRFCEHRRTHYRMRSAENVIAEMEEANSRYRIMEFDFVDSNFCLKKERVVEIAEGIDGRFHFSARARCNDLDSDLIEKLAKAGCFRLHLGIESASPEILKSLNKEVNLERIPGIVHRARGLGVAIVAYFMIGNPGETERKARKTARYSRRIPFDFVQFTRTTAMPFTQLYEDYVKSTGRDPWREFHLTGRMDVPAASDCRLDSTWIDRFVNIAYIRFYLRPAAAYRVAAYLGMKKMLGLIGLGCRLVFAWTIGSRSSGMK